MSKTVDRQTEISAGKSLVCEWTDRGDYWVSQCKHSFGAFASSKGRFFCPGCDRPISFKEQARDAG